MNEEDRSWFDELMKGRMEEFGATFQEVVPQQPVLYGDFMTSGSDSKAYQLIEDRAKVRRKYQAMTVMWL